MAERRKRELSADHLKEYGVSKNRQLSALTKGDAAT